MNSEKILDAMEYLDEEYIDQVYTLKSSPKAPQRVWIKYVSIAACIVLSIIGAISIGLFDGSYRLPLKPDYEDNTGNVGNTNDTSEKEDNTADTSVDDSEPDSKPPKEEPSSSIKEEPSTEESTTEEPTTEESTTEEPTTEELTTEEPTTEESTTEEPFPPCGNVNPEAPAPKRITGYFEFVSVSEDGYVVKMIDNNGNEDFVVGQEYSAIYYGDPELKPDFKVGDKYNIKGMLAGETFYIQEIYE